MTCSCLERGGWRSHVPPPSGALLAHAPRLAHRLAGLGDGFARPVQCLLGLCVALNRLQRRSLSRSNRPVGDPTPILGVRRPVQVTEPPSAVLLLLLLLLKLMLMLLFLLLLLGLLPHTSLCGPPSNKLNKLTNPPRSLLFSILTRRQR